MPHVSSHMTYLLAFKPYAPYLLLCLTRLFPLRVLVLCVPDLHNLSTLSTLHFLFGCLKILLVWICGLSKTFNFPRAVKGTPTVLFFGLERQTWNLLRWGTFLKAYLKHEIIIFFMLFCSSLQSLSNNFLIWNNKKPLKNHIWSLCYFKGGLSARMT